MSARLIHQSNKSLWKVDFDYMLKFVVIGEPFVGKSSILDVVAGEAFTKNRQPTVGIEFHMLRGTGDPVEQQDASMTTEGHNPRKVPTHYKMQMWDCAGQVRFRSIVKSYFRQSNVVLAVFDVTNRDSFEMIRQWLDEVRSQIAEPIVIGLLGNKEDLPNREITDEEATDMCHSLKCDFYYPVSAVNGRNLMQALNVALELIHVKVLNGTLKLRHRTEMERVRNEVQTLNESQPRADVRCADCF